MQYDAFCILWFSNSEYIITEMEISMREDVPNKSKVRIFSMKLKLKWYDYYMTIKTLIDTNVIHHS